MFWLVRRRALPPYFKAALPPVPRWRSSRGVISLPSPSRSLPTPPSQWACASYGIRPVRRGGLVEAASKGRSGYRLTRPAKDISLLDRK
jgi:hypothetical protein